MGHGFVTRKAEDGDPHSNPLSWREVCHEKWRVFGRHRPLALFIPHSRVQIGINQVDEKVEQHHAGSKKEVDSGDHWVVSVIEGIYQETTESRQVEDVLHDHRTPHQDRQLQADQGHHRDEGIFDGVPDNHDPLPESLGPGGADIVLAEHFQHHGAHHPHGGGRRGRPQNQAGNEEHSEVPQRVLVEL